MKSARHESVGKRSVPVMKRIEKVGLSSFLQVGDLSKQTIFSQLLKFVQSGHTSDQDIIYLLQEEGKVVLPEILAPGYLPPDQSRMLMQCIDGLKRAALSQFRIELLVPFLLDKCQLPPDDGEGEKEDLDQMQMAVTALQSLEEPLIAILAKHDGVAKLLALALKSVPEYKLVQKRALEILGQQCVFDPESAKLAFYEYHRVSVFPCLATAVVKKQTVDILFLLEYAPVEMRSECFAYVEMMLSSFPLECDLVAQRKQLESAPIVLEKTCHWSTDYANKLVDLCVRHGWFPCFAQLVDKEDTLEMLRTFASCASQHELHKKQTLGVFECVVSELRDQISQSKRHEFWKVFCLLSLEYAGIGGCELDTDEDYEDHLKMTSISLVGWLIPAPDAEEPGGTLVETLQGILFVMRKLGWDETCKAAKRHLSRNVQARGGLKAFIEMARNRGIKDNEFQVQRWAEQCLAMEPSMATPTKRQRVVVATTDEDDDINADDHKKAVTPLRKSASSTTKDGEKGKEEQAKKKLSTAERAKPPKPPIVVEEDKPAAAKSKRVATTTATSKSRTTTTTAIATSDDEPVARVRAILCQHNVGFQTVMEMSLNSFLEINITSREYYAFELWLHQLDTLMDDAFVSALPASPSERAVIREHRHRLLSLKEVDWVGLGLKSLTWSRAMAMVRDRLANRFNG
ncbi:hypothetical protein BASA81_007840 [Batrachochytrium salamandrivorans]|nr:hypothetical protein BASA81_007840 [Batrachochytrium salamandrivorans]